MADTPPLFRLFQWLYRACGGRHGVAGYSAEFIASPEFLQTPEWARARYEALRANDGRCELCGRGKQQGAWLNVDHVISRTKWPDLALKLSNLQILFGDSDATAGCNQGKGNRYRDDHRPADHPHRPKPRLRFGRRR